MISKPEGGLQKIKLSVLYLFSLKFYQKGNLGGVILNWALRKPTKTKND